MKWNYDNLPFKGTVKDYSEINPGDSVDISSRSVILKSALRNVWNNEKLAMQQRCSEMGCRIQEDSNKTYLTIRFLKA